MKHKIQTLLQGLKPLDISELALLLLTAIVLPFDWQMALQAMLLLLLNTLVKMMVNGIAKHRQKSNSKPTLQHIPLSRWARWALWALIAYYGLYLLSLLYTSNMATAQNYLTRKLPFVGFALFALVSNTSYFKYQHLRLILYGFSAALVVKFFVRFFIMLFTTGTIKFSASFDPLHHTYMAMYILMAFIFLYGELFHHGKDMPKKIIISILIAMLALVADLIFVMSRTGVAGIIVVAAAIIVHQIIATKRFKMGVIAIIVAAACGAGIYALLPESGRRLTQTVSEVGKGNKSDIRFYIMGSALEVIKNNIPRGVGVGDRTDALMEYYKSTDNETAINAEYNPHNIYLDSMLTIGIPGLLLLIGLLVLLSVTAFRKQDFAMLGWLFSIAFSGLFEALFDRQMGIIYFALFFALFCLIRSEESIPSKSSH